MKLFSDDSVDKNIFNLSAQTEEILKDYEEFFKDEELNKVNKCDLDELDSKLSSMLQSISHEESNSGTTLKEGRDMIYVESFLKKYS